MNIYKNTFIAGLLTVGAQAAAGGLSVAGQVAGAAVSTVAAAKPLILLGLGKCKIKVCKL